MKDIRIAADVAELVRSHAFTVRLPEQVQTLYIYWLCEQLTLRIVLELVEGLARFEKKRHEMNTHNARSGFGNHEMRHDNHLQTNIDKRVRVR